MYQIARVSNHAGPRPHLDRRGPATENGPLYSSTRVPPSKSYSTFCLLHTLVSCTAASEPHLNERWPA